MRNRGGATCSRGRPGPCDNEVGITTGICLSFSCAGNGAKINQRLCQRNTVSENLLAVTACAEHVLKAEAGGGDIVDAGGSADPWISKLQAEHKEHLANRACYAMSIAGRQTEW